MTKQPSTCSNVNHCGHWIVQHHAAQTCTQSLKPTHEQAHCQCGQTQSADTLKRKAVYPEVAAQLAAYAFGEEMLDDDGKAQPMPEIKHGVVVRFAIDGSYEVVGCDINLGWEYFKAAKHLHSMTPKQMLLGRMPSPTADPDEQPRRADNLRKRITYIKDNYPAALQELVQQWSPSMPTMKSDHVHTMQQLNEINQLVTRIEAAHTVAFNDIIIKPPPAKKQEPIAVTELPSDNLLVDEDEIIRLRNKLAESSTRVQMAAKTLAKEASAARKSISLSGKPTLRRAALVEFMLNALNDAEGSADLLIAITETLGYKTDQPLGAILGGCDIYQITQMSEMLSQIRDGKSAVTYNNKQNTFSVQKATQQ